MTHGLSLLALGLVGIVACAAEQTDFQTDDDNDGDARAGRAPSAAGSSTLGGSSSAQAGTSTGAGGNGSNTGSAGKPAGGTGTGGRAGANSGGKSGSSSGGKASGGNGAAGSAGTTAGGQAGGPNQPAMCDEATATVLGSMSSNVTVASNVCLKMTLPADQTWIKKITLQPDGGMYPLPFTWSNCGTNSSGAFTANYANSVLNPVTAQCPILVKLGGNGSPINVQWWGG